MEHLCDFIADMMNTNIQHDHFKLSTLATCILISGSTMWNV